MTQFKMKVHIRNIY